MYVEDFFIQQKRQWRRVHHVRRKSHQNASGRPSQKNKSDSAENVCNGWAKMSSQASEDVPVTQTRGNETQWVIYLAVIKRLKSQEWYKRQRMGDRELMYI